MDIYYKIALINLAVLFVYVKLSTFLFVDSLGRNTMSDSAQIAGGLYVIMTGLFTFSQLVRFLWLL